MQRKGVHAEVKELKTDIAVIKDLELSFGRVFEETWTEPVGLTTFPSVTVLREWDHKLLQRYKPMYMPFCDVCCLCTFGKCDLTKDKRGACGESRENPIKRELKETTRLMQKLRCALLIFHFHSSLYAENIRLVASFILEFHGR